MKKIFYTLISCLVFTQFYGQLSFGPRVDYDPGSISPRKVCTADFNGDGIIDLSIVDSNNNFQFLSVFLGTGTGSFGTATNYSVSAGAISMLTSDFNGDGNLDIAIACIDGDNVSILLGNGDGTFNSSVDYPAGNYPISICAGDFNSDGHIDLITGNDIGSNVTIMFGNGNGTFGAPNAVGGIIGGYSNGIGVYSEDINKDGKMDLLAVGSNTPTSNVAILLGTGTGTFSTAINYTVGAWQINLSPSDFNGDNKIDLVIPNYYDSTVTVLLGNGNGTFNPATNFRTGSLPHSVTTNDFNGDGNIDIVTLNVTNYGSSFYFLLGYGDGSFSEPLDIVISGNSQVFSPKSADFNQDGKPDLVIAHAGASVFLNTTTFSAATLNFDGVDDYVSIPMNSSFQFGTGDFTFETWAKTSDAGTNVMLGATGGGQNYWMGISNGNAAINVSGITCLGNTIINNNTWHHIAGVRKSNVLSIYVDGILENSIANTLSANPSSSILSIGSLGGSSSYFNGSIDEVRIWNRALCLGEIKNNIDKEIPTTANSLIANYHFNQGLPAITNSTVTSLADSSGNFNTGTLNNFALTGVISNWATPSPVFSGSSAPAFVNPFIAIGGSNSVCNGSSVALSVIGSALSTYSWTSGPNTSTYVVSPTVTTSYSVIGTNSLGCISNLGTKTILVNPTPSLTAFANNSVLCSGQTTTLNVNGAAQIYTWTPSTFLNAIAGSSVIASPPTTTTYTVTGSIGPCSSSAAVLVAVNPSPFASSLLTQDPITPQVWNITPTYGGGTPPYTYNWSWGDGSPDSPVAYPSHNFPTPGWYTICGTVTDVNGCFATTCQVDTLFKLDQNNLIITVNIINGLTTNMGQSADYNDIIIYPNPSNGIYHIELDAISQIYVMDTFGKIVMKKSFEVGKHHLDIQSQASGIYFIKVIQNTKEYKFKLLKE